MTTREVLESSLREAGLGAVGLLGGAALREACSYLPRDLRCRLGVEGAGGAAVVALAYGEAICRAAPWTASPPPLARIARFARAHWYAELVARLKAATELIRSRLGEAGQDPGDSREWRRFSNSRLPERRLALQAGLGRLGRHGLVMLPESGSAAVLGILLLPAGLAPHLPADSGEPVRGRPEEALDPACAGCGACEAACPTSALVRGRPFARERCLQHWSTVPGRLPPEIEAAWGDRLYGCDACQEACPRYKPDAAATTARGLLGPGLPARWLVSAPEADIAAVLHGSALGLGWIPIEALRRNAALVIRAEKPSRDLTLDSLPPTLDTTEG